jgi:hypothetical protein
VGSVRPSSGYKPIHPLSSPVSGIVKKPSPKSKPNEVHMSAARRLSNAHNAHVHAAAAASPPAAHESAANAFTFPVLLSAGQPENPREKGFPNRGIRTRRYLGGTTPETALKPKGDQKLDYSKESKSSVSHSKMGSTHNSAASSRRKAVNFSHVSPLVAVRSGVNPNLSVSKPKGSAPISRKAAWDAHAAARSTPVPPLAPVPHSDPLPDRPSAPAPPSPL